jgi:hypothetical protein
MINHADGLISIWQARCECGTRTLQYNVHKQTENHGRVFRRCEEGYGWNHTFVFVDPYCKCATACTVENRTMRNVCATNTCDFKCQTGAPRLSGGWVEPLTTADLTPQQVADVLAVWKRRHQLAATLKAQGPAAVTTAVNTLFGRVWPSRVSQAHSCVTVSSSMHSIANACCFCLHMLLYADFSCSTL